MKKILLLVTAALAVASAIPARALDLDVIVNGGTNNVAANSTNTYSPLLTATRSRDIALQGSFRWMAASTSNLTFYVDANIDGGTNWQLSKWSFDKTGSSTNTVMFETNLIVGAESYFRLRVGNQNTAGAATNLVFKTATKSGL